ncbi:G5 domain-containing protein, partial [candidate division WWE3 bacterium]|nr:G5 domain-containing protein [candidate division WWE3 bacterium]
PFEIIYKTDESLEFGKTAVLHEGKPGTKTTKFLLRYYGEQLISKDKTDTQIVEPVNRVISKGTKIVWTNASAERCGEFKYWQRYEKVYMTTYTPQCEGCNAWTSIGLNAGYGIIAVDPKKIPYWTKVCVPGYGIAVAGDTGGAMRSYPGLLIDLGFNSLAPKDKWLTTGRYDMYILNNEAQAEKFFVKDTK